MIDAAILSQLRLNGMVMPAFRHSGSVCSTVSGDSFTAGKAIVVTDTTLVSNGSNTISPSSVFDSSPSFGIAISRSLSSCRFKALISSLTFVAARIVGYLQLPAYRRYDHTVVVGYVGVESDYAPRG